eukprot:g3075.t1
MLASLMHRGGRRARTLSGEVRDTLKRRNPRVRRRDTGSRIAGATFATEVEGRWKGVIQLFNEEKELVTPDLKPFGYNRNPAGISASMHVEEEEEEEVEVEVKSEREKSVGEETMSYYEEMEDVWNAYTEKKLDDMKDEHLQDDFLWLKERVREALKNHPLPEKVGKGIDGSILEMPSSVLTHSLKLYYEHLVENPDIVAPFEKYLQQISTELYVRSKDSEMGRKGGAVVQSEPTEPFNRLMERWIDKLTVEVAKAQKSLLDETPSSRTNHNGMLLLMPPREYATACVQAVMNGFFQEGRMTPVVKIASQVANRLVDCLNVAKRSGLGRARLHGLIYSSKKGLNEHANNTEGSSDDNPDEEAILSFEKNGLLRSAYSMLQRNKWPREEQIKLAGKLMKLLMDVATVELAAKPQSWDPEMSWDINARRVSAIGHRHHQDGMKRQGVLVLHPHVIQLMLDKTAMKTLGSSDSRKALCIVSGGSSRYNDLELTMTAKHAPMVVPPKSWRREVPYEGSLDQRVKIEGGFAVTPSDFVRVRGGRDNMRLVKGVPVPVLYEAMSALGRLPWQVNKFTLGVVDQLVAEGGGILNIPKCRVGYEKELKTEEWARMGRMMFEDDSYSRIASQMRKIDLAREFSKEEALYFPHNCDFRGRAYPLVPVFNHLGDDMTRGLLRFGKGKPLGENGLNWLFIHCANLMGHDKVSLDDRAEWMQHTHMKDIIRCVEDPLGYRWWVEGDSPLQALAVMRDIYSALRSSDPKAYVSHIPVHQDGSCNGLQHYAALGRDEEGAMQVNLMPSTKPADVYTRIKDIVVASMIADKENGKIPEGMELTFDPLLKAMERKTVKQTVMTSVYGVTFVGARMQFHNRIKEKIDKGALDADLFDDRSIFLAANYLARKTVQGIGKAFKSANDIMTWLAEIALIISRYGEPVMWTTPLGMPILQPYRYDSSIQVRTDLQHIVVGVYDSDQPVNSSRQKMAFPPNFVHSLDASHMIMTALSCESKGVAFAAVHDSYWTHAGTVDDMNYELREQFIRLHEHPILEKFVEEVCVRIPGIRNELPPIPTRGTFNIQRVRQSDYFFN